MEEEKQAQTKFINGVLIASFSYSTHRKRRCFVSRAKPRPEASRLFRILMVVNTGSNRARSLKLMREQGGQKIKIAEKKVNNRELTGYEYSLRSESRAL